MASTRNSIARSPAPPTASGPTGQAHYVLGHASSEQRRLDEQGAVLRPFTERLLRAAGISAGARVLDVGCGTGDVAMIAAQLVGATGSVLGIDRSPDVLATAQERAASEGWTHVRFRPADLTTVETDERFDAVVGRQVLVHQPDPAAALCHLAALVRPGGVIAFGEQVVLPELAAPPRPLYTRSVGWCRAALEGAGLVVDTGLHLPAIFRAAGLPAPELRLEGAITAGPDPLHHRWLAGTVRSLLPLMERRGIATAAEARVDTLEERLIAEAIEAGGAACGFALVTAWTRTTSG